MTTAPAGAAPLALVDIGVNLAHESFRHDLPAVLDRARQAGVIRLIATGTSAAVSAEACRLAGDYPGHVFATAGVHPHHASGWVAGTAGILDEILASPAAVAVGECGLDYHRNYSPPADQRRAFAAQLELAVTTGKPVFLHQRDAHSDFLAMLREYRAGLAGGVAHCFTGDRGQLEDYLELGLHIGITGWICDERRGGQLRDAVRYLPASRLLLETDAPYLLPRDLPAPPAGRRNEPACLPHILRTVAHWMGQPVAALAEASTSNAERLFGLRRGD